MGRRRGRRRAPDVGWHARARERLVFWSGAMALSVALLAALLVWPLVEVLRIGLVDPDTGRVTLEFYRKLLTHHYYVGALLNSVWVGLGGMVVACLLGIPLAYFPTRYTIRGRDLISTGAVLALVSPPFIVA